MKKRHFYTENVAISPQVVAFRRFLAKNASIKNHKKGLLKIFRKKLPKYFRPQCKCCTFAADLEKHTGRVLADCLLNTLRVLKTKVNSSTFGLPNEREQPRNLKL